MLVRKLKRGLPVGAVSTCPNHETLSTSQIRPQISRYRWCTRRPWQFGGATAWRICRGLGTFSVLDSERCISKPRTTAAALGLGQTRLRANHQHLILSTYRPINAYERAFTARVV